MALLALISSQIRLGLRSLVAIIVLNSSAEAAGGWMFPKDFEFGIATAPGHVEDQLRDTWIHWAKQGKVRAFANTARAEERLGFWSHPEIEIALAKEAGVKVFRLGVDWGRLIPVAGGPVDEKALKRYQEIFKLIKQSQMKIMLTLFHHSEPPWALQQGSWLSQNVEAEFIRFSKIVIDRMGSEIDYLITFNEPTAYAFFTQVTGTWPTNRKINNVLRLVDLGPVKGPYTQVLNRMISAHSAVYHYAKQKRLGFKIGIAHLSVLQKPISASAELAASVAKVRFGSYFPDQLRNQLDFLGINYYGLEILDGFSIIESRDHEYSESGRAIHPQGLYDTLLSYHKRYNLRSNDRNSTRSTKELPLFITESGIADSTDVLRPAYLIEHLLAVRKAMEGGVPVLGFAFWTMSDNWEWADGYCPKFGLVSVDRNDLSIRHRRDSFYLFQKIATQRVISAQERAAAWEKVENSRGQWRPMCRSADGINGLDEPRMVPFKSLDWRFDY